MAVWPHNLAAPFLSFGLRFFFQVAFCCLVIWSQWAGLGGSGVGAVAWAALGSAAGLPVELGGKGPGGGAGRGGPWGHR